MRTASKGHYSHMVIIENFIYVHGWDERTPTYNNNNNNKYIYIYIYIYSIYYILTYIDINKYLIIIITQ